MAKQQDQQKRRRPGILRDQWNRAYATVIDRATGDPIGALSPKFTAPLNPPDGPEFWRVLPEHPGRIEIRYAQWSGFLRGRRQEYLAKQERDARQMYGDKAADAIQKPPPELRRLSGTMPYPYEIIDAAAQGNGFVLGLRKFDPTKPVDVKLQAILNLYQLDRFERSVELPTEDWSDDGEFTPAVEPAVQVPDEHAGTLTFS